MVIWGKMDGQRREVWLVQGRQRWASQCVLAEHQLWEEGTLEDGGWF